MPCPVAVRGQAGVRVTGQEKRKAEELKTERRKVGSEGGIFGMKNATKRGVEKIGGGAKIFLT
jgi:hypothetical protein